jgi:hypothetical protein
LAQTTQENNADPSYVANRMNSAILARYPHWAFRPFPHEAVACVNRVASITAVQPLHVAAWIEQQTREHAAPTAKLRLAATRGWNNCVSLLGNAV